MVKSDILFLLSGGQANDDPNKSLGGARSDQNIDNHINNLFDDVTREHSFTGYVDYRCLYILNNSPDEKLKDFSLYVHKNLTGSEISLGLSLQSDVQALMITGSPPDGHANFQLQYVLKQNGITHIQTTRTINWTTDVSNMANRIAAILNSMDFVHGVQCVGNHSGGGYDFLITFGGSSSGRAQELLGVVNQEGIQVSIMSVIKGGPINSQAPNIGQSNNPPNGVTFFDTDNLTPIKIGTLMPQDSIPIWLRRTTLKNTPPIHPDQCRLHLFGDPEFVLQSNRTTHIDTTTRTKMKSVLMYF